MLRRVVTAPVMANTVVGRGKVAGIGCVRGEWVMGMCGGIVRGVSPHCTVKLT